jgi:hypothetical protein
MSEFITEGHEFRFRQTKMIAIDAYGDHFFGYSAPSNVVMQSNGAALQAERALPLNRSNTQANCTDN